jgi:hypothetical protein
MQELSRNSMSQLVPPPEAVRARLAVLLTEAAVLRRQLKVSERAAREAQRLREQLAAAQGGNHAA